MGKDFNSRNDTGQTGNVPLDGPGSPYAAKVFAGPSFDTGNVDGPNEQCSTSKEPYEAPTQPGVDGPNSKEPEQVKGRDANPTY